MYKKMNNDSSRYAYATGRIRALEARLISASRLDRYLESRSAEDVGRLLIENGYPAAADPEISLHQELEATYALIRSLSPNPQMVDTLLLFRDFHNLKVMLKAFSVYWPHRESGSPVKTALAIEQIYEGGGHPQAEGVIDLEGQPGQAALWPAIHGPVTFEQLMPLLQHPANVDPQILFNALREQKPGDMPPALAKAAATASSRYLQTYDISEIDIQLDKIVAQMISDAARLLDIPFFSDYLQLRFDLINVGLLLRTRFLHSGPDYLQRILLPGGSLSPASLIACYEKSASDINELLVKTRLAPLANAIEGFAGGGNAISQFSLAADDLLVKSIQKARFVLRGPEVLLGYLIAREMEIKTVRIILTCLRNRIPTDKARELARLTYL